MLPTTHPHGILNVSRWWDYEGPTFVTISPAGGTVRCPQSRWWDNIVPQMGLCVPLVGL